MMHPGLHPDQALIVLRRHADERVAPLTRAGGIGVRARFGRRLMVWGARLAPPERDPSPATRWAATMVP